MAVWINAFGVNDVDDEDVIRFDHGSRSFINFRDHKDYHYCTDGRCTHEDVQLEDGLVVEATIECPKHSPICDCTTGDVEMPPACENPCTYPTKVEGDRVFVEI